MDRPAYDTPNCQCLFLADKDVGMRGAAGAQQHPIGNVAELFDGEIAVHYRDHHTAIDGVDGTVHHQQVTMVDTESDHRLSRHADEESRLLVGDQVFVQIDALLGVVIGGRRKPGRHRCRQDWDTRQRHHGKWLVERERGASEDRSAPRMKAGTHGR